MQVKTKWLGIILKNTIALQKEAFHVQVVVNAMRRFVVF